MKRILPLTLLMLVAVALASCSSNDVYDEMPEPIAKFVSRYYPNSQIDDVQTSANGYIVTIKNGPTMTFDSGYTWTEVNGNGSVIPQVFLFDQLPPDLYQYLQESNNTDNVFTVTRTNSAYTVRLLNSSLYYNSDTGAITGELHT